MSEYPLVLASELMWVLELNKRLTQYGLEWIVFSKGDCLLEIKPPYPAGVLAEVRRLELRKSSGEPFYVASKYADSSKYQAAAVWKARSVWKLWARFGSAELGIELYTELNLQKAVVLATNKFLHSYLIELPDLSLPEVAVDLQLLDLARKALEEI